MRLRPRNPKTAERLRTIGINLLVLFVLASVVYWAIPLVSTIGRAFSGLRAQPIPPAYTAEEAKWLPKHRQELGRFGTVYKSFIEWRREAFAGETINVEGPYLQRRTLNVAAPDARKVYFFGGSTMWGPGVDDANTIPSLFAKASGLRAENFADSGYIAHQGLLQLIQLLQDGHRPDLVVFYDGVNDTLFKCRSELGPHSHEREQQIAGILKTSANPHSFSYYLAPFAKLAQNLSRETGRAAGAEEFDCHANPAKAQAIADNLIQDWRFAKHLVELHGGKFLAALQPVSFFSRTRLDELRLPAAFERQYRTVYPLLRDKVARSGEFHDLVGALDTGEAVYTDFCHLAPRGNRIIADRLATLAVPLIGKN